MYFFLMLALSTNNAKSISATFTDTAPVIDGYIEEIWQITDTVYDFVQYMPYENKKILEQTVVYLLYDKNNLYIAFRCHTNNRRPVAHLMGGEDWVCLYLDTFNNKTTAYFFRVTASGIQEDGIILDDGRQFDFSWDGVWYSAVRCYDDRYEVEIKIPFKSIRYDKKVSEWGANFKRFIPINQETDFWVLPSQREGLRVSKFGVLTGINPKSSGHYLEFYPEGIFRYENYYGVNKKFLPQISLNLKWDLTSQSAINTTIHPDFAQIESDPYTLNLSQYPIYLMENRPFFVEGSDIFKMANFDDRAGFYQPLEIFYSRSVGKSLNDRPVPIIGGLKFTSKATRWNTGFLGVLTDSLETEPEKWFSVVRIKRSIFENSALGLLLSGMHRNETQYNYTLGTDFAYRFRTSQLLFQSAVSDYQGKVGLAFTGGFKGYIGNFLTKMGFQTIDDSFDVREIGYVPWIGRKSISITSGPYREFASGFIQNLFCGLGIQYGKEPGVMDWSKVLNVEFSGYFRNNWTLDIKTKYGSVYQTVANYNTKDIDLWLWGTNSKTYDVSLGIWYNYGYNYLRNCLGYQGSEYLWCAYYLFSRFSLIIESNTWVEWDNKKVIIAITPVVTPRIEFRISKDAKFSVFNEFVFTTPGTDFGKTEYLTNRFGFLFSYNFKPKSWLYIALNDYRVQDETDRLTLKNQVGAIKAKYLIYF